MRITKLRLFLFLIMISFLIGCNPIKKQYRAENKRKKEFEKEKAKREKEAEEAFDMAMKRHYKMQTKETRKAMKKGKREAERYKENRVKKEFFIKRWFTSRKRRNKEIKNE